MEATPGIEPGYTFFRPLHECGSKSSLPASFQKLPPTVKHPGRSNIAVTEVEPWVGLPMAI